jgi:hypothetical protein
MQAGSLERRSRGYKFFEVHAMRIFSVDLNIRRAGGRHARGAPATPVFLSNI